MASLSIIEAELNGLPAEMRTRLLNAFRETLKMRFGRATPGRPAENMTGAYFEAVTPGTPGDEFSIEHGFGVAPYMVVPVLPLAVGWSVVPVTVTKAPDAKRIYLSSTVADASVVLYVER